VGAYCTSPDIAVSEAKDTDWRQLLCDSARGHATAGVMTNRLGWHGARLIMQIDRVGGA